MSAAAVLTERPLVAQAFRPAGRPIEEAPEVPAVTEREEVRVAPTFRLRPIMRQGTASSIPQTWTRFATIEDARQSVKAMYHDDRVLRVFIVTGDAPPQFVEWVER